jgi:hypothetical protein
MSTQLAGYEPLQNKILMYCLGTPTAAVMKPIVSLVEQHKSAEMDLSCETAWRYYSPKKDGAETALKKARMYSFSTYIVNKEMDIARLEMPGSNPEAKEEAIEEFVLAKKTLLQILYHKSTKKETDNGTPTGIIMRKYMYNLFRKGLKLRGNETMWARFSFGEILSCERQPMTTLQLKPEVLCDLTKAMKQRILEDK